MLARLAFIEGSQHLLEGVTPHGSIADSARDAVVAEMRHHFRPEFLNRIDDTVLFKPLTLEETEQIVELMIAELRDRLALRGIGLDLTPAARELVARSGFDPVYGARPLKRYLQRELETRIGRALIAGDIVEGSSVSVDVENGSLAVEVAEAKPATHEEPTSNSA